MATRAIARRRRPISYLRARARRRSHGMEIPLAPLAGLMAGTYDLINPLMQGNFRGVGENLAYRYAAYDPWKHKFSMGGLSQGLFPLVAGVMVHKLANKIGVNRLLRSSGIPLIRI